MVAVRPAFLRALLKKEAKTEAMASDFNPEQKRYLEGFLAVGLPLRRRMMAAMGQQDCGQCGYNCQDYSDLIFLKKEERPNLCVPGGKETTRMLKALHQELGNAPAAAPIAKAPDKTIPAPADATVAPAAAPETSREHPAEARFLSRTRLIRPASEKETWHIELDLAGTGIYYAVGNAKHMARDVEGAWVEIVAQHGARTTDEAIAFIANLKKSGRYQQDVY